MADRGDLIHVHGGEPGLRRERRDDGVVILDANGEAIADEPTLERVRRLRIPPAWTDVWIAAMPNAHLQATGVDAKGRRQYLYHPAWRERRDQEKFDDMLAFAARLPAVREKAQRLLANDGPPRERTLALALRLLDVGLFRVGWDRYARDNGHVGLTTLRRHEVTVDGTAARFDYTAKSGKRRRLTVRDPQSVRALAPLQRRRGPPDQLLVYRAGASAGGWRRIQAPDVNNALRCWAQGPYSAKEFRTWAATALAAVALAREEAAARPRNTRAVARAVRQVSAALGNTPAVARASYIDPRVVELYEEGKVIELPADLPDAAVPLRIEAGRDGVIIELPTDVDGDELRSEVERRVRELLESAPAGQRAARNASADAVKKSVSAPPITRYRPQAGSRYRYCTPKTVKTPPDWILLQAASAPIAPSRPITPAPISGRRVGRTW
jgi:DNA topoisomerase IB